MFNAFSLFFFVKEQKLLNVVLFSPIIKLMHRSHDWVYDFIPGWFGWDSNT